MLEHGRLHAAHSKYAIARACPHPATDPEGSVTALRELATPRQEKPVLFVTADENIGPVAKYRDALRRFVRFNFPDPALLAKIVDKAAQVALAAFTLHKLRQNTHGFGFSCLVETIENEGLLAIGTEFFRRIGYRGAGSAEFKFDARNDATS